MLISKGWPLAVATVLLCGAASAQGKDRATKDDYDLNTGATSSELKVGEEGTFSLVVEPKNGTKVHPQAPLEVKLGTPAGVKVGKGKLGRGDVQDKEAKSPDMRTALHGEKAGEYVVEADVSFFLCTDEWCQRMTDRVAVPVRVKN